MDFWYFDKIVHFWLTWWQRQLAGLCSAKSSYKTNEKWSISTLNIHVVKICYHLKKSFFVKNTFLLTQKNPFLEWEAHFEIKKIENTLRFQLFFDKLIDFFVLKIDKIVKKALCFTSKPTSEKSIIWSCYVTRRSNHKKCIFKNVDKQNFFDQNDHWT